MRPERKACRSILALLCIGCFTGSEAVPQQLPRENGDGAVGKLLTHEKPIHGPVTDKIFADPSVIKVDDTYYAYATQGKPFGDRFAVPMASSKDFKTWSVQEKDALPDLPSWAKQNKDQSIWAPDVIQSPTGTFLMYFTAVIKDSDKHRCIGVAKASSPTGPFKPQGDGPIVCLKADKVIDPCGWVGVPDPDKKGDPQHFLLYKHQYASTSSIMVQPMTSDGLKTQGEPWPIVHARPDELNDNEAPSLVYAGGSFVLFFSTGSWDSTTYTVSVATSPNLKPKQMFEKRREPLLKTGSGNQWGFQDKNPVAPGGADVLWQEDIKDLEGGGQSVRIVFHAAKGLKQLESRHLWIGAVKVKDGQVDML